LARWSHKHVGEVLVRLPFGLGHIVEREVQEPKGDGNSEEVSCENRSRQDQGFEDDAGEFLSTGQVVVGTLERGPEQIEHPDDADDGQRRVEHTTGDRESQGCRRNRVVFIAGVCRHGQGLIRGSASVGNLSFQSA